MYAEAPQPFEDELASCLDVAARVPTAHVTCEAAGLAVSGRATRAPESSLVGTHVAESAAMYRIGPSDTKLF